MFTLLIWLILFGVFAWHFKAKEPNKANRYFSILMIVGITALIIYFGADIPSAWNGGETIYIDQQPQKTLTNHFTFIYANNQRLIFFGSPTAKSNEIHVPCRIRYTKNRRFVMKIEKAEPQQK